VDLQSVGDYGDSPAF